MHSTVAAPAYANERTSCAPKSSNAVPKLLHSHVNSYWGSSRSGLVDSEILNSVMSGTMKKMNRKSSPGAAIT